MTELEQTLLNALKALESERESAQTRMDGMSQHIERQQVQIDQLTRWATEQRGSVAQLAKSVSDCVNTLTSSSKQR